MFLYNVEAQQGSLSIFTILILQFHFGVGQERNTAVLSKTSALTRKKTTQEITLIKQLFPQNNPR